MTEVVERRAARVLVVDPAGQVLMVHGFDPHDPGRTYWYTIGGGVDPGEADIDAAVREVWEETGLLVTRENLVGPVHHDEVEFPFEGRTFVQRQTFFVLPTQHYHPRPVALEDTEIRSTVEIGWVDPRARETLMGDRLYNATTGRFTSVDPEPGGNETAYSYPNDPINMYDLDGHWGWKKVGRWVKKHKWDIALAAVSFVPGVGLAAWAVRGAVWGARAYRGYRAVSAAKKALTVARRAITTAKPWKSYARLGKGASGRIRLSIGQTKKHGIQNGGRGPQWNLHVDRKYAAFNHYGRGYYKNFWGR